MNVWTKPEPDTNEGVTWTVRRLMKRTRTTQDQLARALNVNKSGITQRCNGKTRWQVDELRPIADLFGLTPVELIAGYDAIREDRLPPEVW